MNLYAYSDLNPSNRIDPYGLEVFDPNDLLDTGFERRSPDYYSFTINIPIKNPKTAEIMGWMFVFEIDRYGRMYRSSTGVSAGVAKLFVTGSAVAGWIDDECGKPSPDKLKKFLNGPSINVSGGIVLGGGYTFVPNKWNDWQRGFEIGFYSPQIGVGGAYSKQIK